ncbi:hypothetical protein GCM10009680_58530 [Streptomyces yatensis]|uniref:Uncharacterized protein n=1 Tax=Streptomyces yatensis TaxID=155177 RepID=A0ABN2IR70_9ACTN
MRSAERATVPRTGRMCPACHYPLTAKMTRHKTMGIFVPLWTPGTCHNPTCPKHAQAQAQAQGEKSPRGSGAKP